MALITAPPELKTNIVDEYMFTEAGGSAVKIIPFENKVNNVVRQFEVTDTGIGLAGHCNDTDTSVHSWRMAAYVGAIARCVGWEVEQAEMLELAAPMHDTGKIGIPDALLKKPASLDAEEWKIMKIHPVLGHRILSKNDAPIFKMAADIALYHHEKWDGSGYPEGLAGSDIPQSARIVAITDVFDALTLRRSYKEPWSEESAFAEIRNCVGSHFDPELMVCFFDVQEEIQELKAKWDEKEKFENKDQVNRVYGPVESVVCNYW